MRSPQAFEIAGFSAANRNCSSAVGITITEPAFARDWKTLKINRVDKNYLAFSVSLSVCSPPFFDLLLSHRATEENGKIPVKSDLTIRTKDNYIGHSHRHFH